MAVTSFQWMNERVRRSDWRDGRRTSCREGMPYRYGVCGAAKVSEAKGRRGGGQCGVRDVATEALSATLIADDVEEGRQCQCVSTLCATCETSRAVVI